MSDYYFAAIVKEPDESGYSVYIPDVPNCFTGADSLPEAMDLAADVLKMMLEDLTADNKAIPMPSDRDKVKKLVTASRKSAGLETPDDTLYQLIKAPSLDMVVKRVNITLPKAALDEIDRKASAYGMTRSGFIARAAAEYRP